MSHVSDAFRLMSRKAAFFFSNRSFSNSSRAKARTTRLPAMFSWALVLSLESRSRTSTKIGWIFFENNRLTIAMQGATISITRVKRASTVKK